MARIESDARSADDNLYVEFYSKPVKQEFRSQEAGRPIFEDVVYVRIHTPSDQLTIIDTIAREDHKSRFPKHWAHFMNKHANDVTAVGTPVTEWPYLTAAQAEELKALKFYTVELLAAANDQQLQKLGMIAGSSGYTLRDKAKAFLSLADDSAEVAKREREIAELREENAKIQAQMKALLEMTSEKKPRAKKAKAEEAEEE